MVEVTRRGLLGSEVQGILRPVSDRFEPVSAASREVALSAGAELMDRLGSYEEIPTGAAVVTPAGELPCEVLIHLSIQDQAEAVSEGVVERAFLNGLRRAAALGIACIATPPLGTGAQGLQAESAARAMQRALDRHRKESPLPDRILIAVASDYEEDVFTRLLKEADVGA